MFKAKNTRKKKLKQLSNTFFEYLKKHKRNFSSQPPPPPPSPS